MIVRFVEEMKEQLSVSHTDIENAVQLAAGDRFTASDGSNFLSVGRHTCQRYGLARVAPEKTGCTRESCAAICRSGQLQGGHPCNMFGWSDKYPVTCCINFWGCSQVAYYKEFYYDYEFYQVQ